MNRLWRIVGIFLVAAGAATVALAQISVPGVPLPQLPRLPVGTDPVTGTLRTAQSSLTEARQLRIRELLRTERKTVESDPEGQPILRRQIGALSPSPEALERAQAEGFTVLRTESLAALGLMLVVLRGTGGPVDATRAEAPARTRSRRKLRLQPSLSRCRSRGGSRGTHSTRCAGRFAGDCGVARRAHRIDRQRRRRHSSRARGREDRAARLRGHADARAAWHRGRVAPHRQGRRIPGRDAGRHAVCGGYLLRTRRRLDRPCSRSRSTGWRASRYRS